MAITSIRVAHKSVRVNERFTEWLKDKQPLVLGGLDLAEVYIPALLNGEELPDLLLQVDAESSDLLRFTNDFEGYYYVSFLEYQLDEENEKSYLTTNTEQFDINKQHDAIEAFMLRWNSKHPVKPSYTLK